MPPRCGILSEVVPFGVGRGRGGYCPFRWGDEGAWVEGLDAERQRDWTSLEAEDWIGGGDGWRGGVEGSEVTGGGGLE